MADNRVFFPQEALDIWVDDKAVTLEGEFIKLNPGGPRMTLTSAVRFLQEVGGGGDAKKLVGKVQTMEQLEALGGEYCANSVLLEEDAYDVVEGFLAEPLPDPTGEDGGKVNDRIADFFAENG
jgi:hypothetical protein